MAGGCGEWLDLGAKCGRLRRFWRRTEVPFRRSLSLINGEWPIFVVGYVKRLDREREFHPFCRETIHDLHVDGSRVLCVAPEICIAPEIRRAIPGEDHDVQRIIVHFIKANPGGSRVD